ncbi:MAG: DNA-directed RNA polymerase subunit beta [Deltaproteobacteria bacterium]|nr:MAG: DNA-directed RNA polymerase subunit beta [Deltaproteobacteria bacterium]
MINKLSERLPFTVRKRFAPFCGDLSMPHLLDIQKKSFEKFLQTQSEWAERKKTGLQAAFESVFPIENSEGTARVEYLGYTVGEPLCTVKECREKGLTFEAPLYVRFRLELWNKAKLEQESEEPIDGSRNSLGEEVKYTEWEDEILKKIEESAKILPEDGESIEKNIEHANWHKEFREAEEAQETDFNELDSEEDYEFADKEKEEDILLDREDRKKRILQFLASPIMHLEEAWILDLEEEFEFLKAKVDIEEGTKDDSENFRQDTSESKGSFDFFFQSAYLECDGEALLQNMDLQGFDEEVIEKSCFLKDESISVESCKIHIGDAGREKTLKENVFVDGDIWGDNENVKVVKEQTVFFGDIPMMTEQGTFIINGTERVIVSQLHRSPGIFFDAEVVRHNKEDKAVYNAKIIPFQGSWLDFEYDHKEQIYCRIDRKRKFLVTVFLKALGYSLENLLNMFYRNTIIFWDENGYVHREINYKDIVGQETPVCIIDREGEVVLREGQVITYAAACEIQKLGLTQFTLGHISELNFVSAEDVLHEKEDVVALEMNEVIDALTFERLFKLGITTLKVLDIPLFDAQELSIRNSLAADKLLGFEESVCEIVKRINPNTENLTMEEAISQFHNTFFNPEKYDLSEIGRLKFNYKFKQNTSLDDRVLSRKDILNTLNRLISIGKGDTEVDDIDHLGNRKLKGVGDLLESQYRLGLTRMERQTREKLSHLDVDPLMPDDVINIRPVISCIREFFTTSPLSQFMDQTNPLSEVTHKRRISALGPGGLNRERAGFDVRDVHYTHYGRLCPIETPEGQNIGLVSSLAMYAIVNEQGLIEAPYKLVVEGRVTSTIKYLTALEESNYRFIAPADAKYDAQTGQFTQEVRARYEEYITYTDPEEIELIDVDPNQVISVAAGLIPFLAHDDANRALMGSNMQRQAVPLMRPEAPLIGTGIEDIVAKDSGACCIALQDGIVDYVDSSKIVIRTNNLEGNSDLFPVVDVYRLEKYRRTNQNTCFNQRAIVNIGDQIRKGDVLADGPGISNGEMALGKNVSIAFMTWYGYNFEDSILISERLIKDDVFTSIHIEEFECSAKDTNIGAEEITKDIPHVTEEELRNLDEFGIVKIGAVVKGGDILVGRVSPKGETQISPEERLLKAVFGEKVSEVKNTSLRMPKGLMGTVISVSMFNRRVSEKDSSTLRWEQKIEEDLNDIRNEEISVLKKNLLNEGINLLKDQFLARDLLSVEGKVLLKKGTCLNVRILQKISWEDFNNIIVQNHSVQGSLFEIKREVQEKIHTVNSLYLSKVLKMKEGCDLPPGILKTIRVNIAIKRELQPGDKMSGRHGNKGVISKIVPEEDMPYLSDGTPIDVVLNPLGVPSRMNVGQVLEIHLGWAAKELGKKIECLLHEYNNSGDLTDARLLVNSIYQNEDMEVVLNSLPDKKFEEFASKLIAGIPMATSVFGGANEADIRDLLIKAEENTTGQSILFDGRTGEAFDRDITVGIMYMLKLYHLVDDKIHARSTGPYSLVTQQPLGGKSHFGGQRLGEMEVWAMEAYGAAFSLQEFLTVKSDDIKGRGLVYESIIKGDQVIDAGVPESFNVLVKELQSLALDIQLFDSKGDIVLTEKKVDRSQVFLSNLENKFESDIERGKIDGDSHSKEVIEEDEEIGEDEEDEEGDAENGEKETVEEWEEDVE